MSWIVNRDDNEGANEGRVFLTKDEVSKTEICYQKAISELSSMLGSDVINIVYSPQRTIMEPHNFMICYGMMAVAPGGKFLEIPETWKTKWHEELWNVQRA